MNFCGNRGTGIRQGMVFQENEKPRELHPAIKAAVGAGKQDGGRKLKNWLKPRASRQKGDATWVLDRMD